MKPLRIGFASLYAWRPHVEHMMFLARLVQQAGHAAVYLACDADLPACYTRELRDVRPDWMECLMCRAGGVRSYVGSGVSSIGALAPEGGADERAYLWAGSSAATLGRFAFAADYTSGEFDRQRKRLAPAIALTYGAAREWIRREQLDAVVLFNGRMDSTRAIFEAAHDAGIRVVTFERSWFGGGIQLLPDETCLGLKSIHGMVREWSSVPLSVAQARLAASYVASRLSGTNLKEWRAYNRDAQATGWPVAGGRRRILLLPGSLNEFWGEADWQSEWPEPTQAYDALTDHLGLGPQDLLLRCHPNWGERIGKNDGRHPERYYSDWARARGVRVISSREKVSTMALIAQCDAVVLASGTAALEAAAMGKQVIATAPSFYQEAGFRTDAGSPQRVAQVRLQVDVPPQELVAAQRQLRRMGLRFCYTMTHRLPQYVQHVRALSSSAYRYPPGADPQRLLEIIRTGRLQADDASRGSDESEEDEVLQRMQDGDWANLTTAAPDDGRDLPRVSRRWLLRPVDYIRDKMPLGDR
ncbi:MAG: glycosyltransferase family 4 protein [Ramlibacter sp.]|nr:glycosyltransferase family 4 protein [Ramlibacter sp.]